MSGPSRPDVDVAVVGAGPVGAALALGLGDAGVPVTLLEASPAPRELPPGYDDRPIALAHDSSRILDSLGAWRSLAERATAIRTVHVSARGMLGFTRIRASEEGVDALGYVVAGTALGDVLMERVAAHRRIRVLRPARVVAAERTAGARVLTIERDGERLELRARLLVAADGTASPLREMLGLRLRRRDYRQHAVVANVTPSRAPRGRAFERFSADGPLALLPNGDRRCGLVWALPPDRAEALAGADDQSFLARLGATFGRRLGEFERVGRRIVYPLALGYAPTQVRTRAVLIGNAAHTLHPVAGQGFNLGLRDAAWLAETVADAVREGGDPGDAAVLDRYIRRRRADQRAVMLFTDLVARALASALPGVRAAAALALVGLDLGPALRHQLAHRAMGAGGPRSRLSRGLPA